MSGARNGTESIRALAFPFPAYRPGQRDLAVAAYRVLANGGRLFLAAPTGIGKTISVLFPAVKALGEGKLERIFYLTARTVGRAIAEKAVADLRQGGLKLRTVTLTAKEKVCVRAGQPCDPQTCPLALGYYDRVKPAMRDALGREEINRSTLEAVAQKHQVCPFELSLDVSTWSDAVICDYNYVFDPQVYLRRHFAEGAANMASSWMKPITWWSVRGKCSPPIWMAGRFLRSDGRSSRPRRVAPKRWPNCIRGCGNSSAPPRIQTNRLKFPILLSISICFQPKQRRPANPPLLRLA
jgi:Rad3-related DNA helicase